MKLYGTLEVPKQNRPKKRRRGDLPHLLYDCPELTRQLYAFVVTYRPHKAVAEVSNHNEPMKKIRNAVGSKVIALHIQLFCFELTN